MCSDIISLLNKIRMRVAILSTITYPSVMANRVHVLNMAKSFVQSGAEVVLFGREVVLKDMPAFTIKNFSGKRSFSIVLAQLRHLRTQHYDLVFIREPRVLFWYIIYSFFFRTKGSKIIYEVHDMPRDLIDYLVIKFFSQLLLGVVVITKSLKNDLCKLNKKLESKIVVLPDGVDPERFDIDLTIAEARQVTGLPEKEKIVVYTGSLYAWKGIHTLKEAAQKMGDTLFLFVGGRNEEVREFQQECHGINNIKIIGYVEQKEIPAYMKSADVLVLPNTAKIPLSSKYTSPLKLFEYMMSKRIIVASATEAIAEVLTDGRNSYLFKPDNAEDLCRVLKKALSEEKNGKIQEQAYMDALGYTWDKRVARMLDFYHLS